MPSPAPRPQALAFDGSSLWVGSIETDRLYAIDPTQWTITQEAQAPGKPWGMAVVGDEMRVLLGMPPDDDRYVKRFIPGHGFKETGAFPCPENTGSHLSWDGEFLYVSQWYNKRLLELSEKGEAVREIDVPHGICGQVVVGGKFFLLTTDDEESNDYWITQVDAHGVKPLCKDVARVPFHARALAYDGSRFWTNHRENDQIVAFTLP